MSKVHWVNIYVTIFMCIFLVSCSSNYHIEKAGTLQDLLKGDTHKIDNLVLSGFINSADFSTMSEMCSFGILKTIDLTECKVVADNKNSANVIPLNAFKDAKELVSIKLPATIKKISSNSFSNCHKLINIDIPKSVTIIDDEAFSGCEKMVLSKLHDGLIKIGNSAFSKCQNITFDLPKTVSEIGEDAFVECINIASITIPDNITEIKAGTFALCSNLSFVRFPKNLYSIGRQSFSGCRELKEIKLPDNVVYIGNSAFESCVQLEKVFLSNKLRDIGISAFKRCSQLETVIFPESLKNIETMAFRDCPSLRNVKIPDGAMVAYAAFDESLFSNDSFIEKHNNLAQSDNIQNTFNLLGAWSVELPDSYLTIAFKDGNVVEAKSKGKSDYYVNTQRGTYSMNNNIIAVNTEDGEKITLYVKENSLYAGSTKLVKGDLVGSEYFAPAGTREAASDVDDNVTNRLLRREKEIRSAVNELARLEESPSLSANEILKIQLLKQTIVRNYDEVLNIAKQSGDKDLAREYERRRDKTVRALQMMKR